MTTVGDVEEQALGLGAALGFPADAAAALAGGNQNHAVRLRRAQGGDVVVRFSRDPDRLLEDPFDVERWSAAAAARAGVRTPEVLARGHVGDVSVLVHRYAPGAPARAEDPEAWRAVGRTIAALRDVDLDGAPGGLFSRFGRDLDAAWEQHLDYNAAALDPDDPLLDLGVYAAGARHALLAVLDRLRGRRIAQGLVHGDLSTRNVLEAPDGYVVLDWGAASTGPVPWTDLERIRRWERTADPESPVPPGAWAAVLDGAGLTQEEAEPVLADLAVLQALDVVRWARDRRPDRLAELAHESRTTIHRDLEPG